MGRHLTDRGLSFVIADSNPEVGHVWRSRWASLRLFTAGQYNDLPGMSFPAARNSYPGKDDVADYLQSYVSEFDLPVRLNTTVTRLTRDDDGYLAETNGGTIRAQQVVVATGPFQVPFIPPASEQLDPTLTQLHSSSYRRPDDLPGGRVLVVGGANSGQQIAQELSASRPVEISVGQKLPTLPQTPLGRDIWWWLTRTRLAHVKVSSRLGQRLSQRDVVIGGGLKELRRRQSRSAHVLWQRPGARSPLAMGPQLITTGSSGRQASRSIIRGSRSPRSKASTAKCTKFAA